jgi:hypothetical protein
MVGSEADCEDRGVGCPNQAEDAKEPHWNGLKGSQ